MNVFVDLVPQPNAALLLDFGSLTRQWRDGFFSSLRMDVAGTFTTGAPPMVVASTKKVVNLNADYLDDKNAADFADASHTHPYVPLTTRVDTQWSLTGGGPLSGNLLLYLVGDVATPAASQYYGTNVGGTRGWYNLPTGNVGTVTSVGLTMPGSVFVSPVVGSPVTGSGTFIPDFKPQAQRTFFAGPLSGANAVPAFRPLVYADISDPPIIPTVPTPPIDPSSGTPDYVAVWRGPGTKLLNTGLIRDNNIGVGINVAPAYTTTLVSSFKSWPTSGYPEMQSYDAQTEYVGTSVQGVYSSIRATAKGMNVSGDMFNLTGVSAIVIGPITGGTVTHAMGVRSESQGGAILNRYAFYAARHTGSSSSVTYNYGFYSDELDAATLGGGFAAAFAANFGFSPERRYGIYLSGLAQNYIRGPVGIGSGKWLLMENGVLDLDVNKRISGGGLRDTTLPGSTYIGTDAQGNLQPAPTPPALPTIKYGITQPSKGITVTGSPTLQDPGWNWVFALADDLGALEIITGQGYVKRAGTDVAPTYSTVALIPWGEISGFTGVTSVKVTNTAGFACTPTTATSGAVTIGMVLANDLLALEGLGVSPTTGYARRTGTDAWELKTQIPWTDISGAQVGVTSVGLSIPTDVFNITVPTVTATGTLTAIFQPQAQKTFFAGPLSGSNATPAFRPLVYADISDPPVIPTVPTPPILPSSGLNDYVARWVDDVNVDPISKSLSYGLIRDNNIGVGINAAPSSLITLNVGQFVPPLLGVNEYHTIHASVTYQAPYAGVDNLYKQVFRADMAMTHTSGTHAFTASFLSYAQFNGVGGTTGQHVTYYSGGAVAAGAFLTTRYGFHANIMNDVGPGISFNYGFICSDLGTPVTRAASFVSTMGLMVGKKYGLYFSGAAQNWLAGALGIGTARDTITGGYILDISGKTVTDNQIVSTLAGNMTGPGNPGTSPPFVVASKDLNYNLNAELYNGYKEISYTPVMRAGYTLVGGGTLCATGAGGAVTNPVYVTWSARIMTICNGYGSHFASSSYFSIDLPPDGTVITVVGGSGGTVTKTAAGIPLTPGTYDALYYILTIGGAASDHTRWRIVRHPSVAIVPPEWIRIAAVNNDQGHMAIWFNQERTKIGQCLDTTTGQGSVSPLTVSSPDLICKGSVIANTTPDDVLTRLAVSSGTAYLKLEGDVVTCPPPAGPKYYGYNAAGTRGFYNLPAGSSGTVDGNGAIPFVARWDGPSTIKSGIIQDTGLYAGINISPNQNYGFMVAFSTRLNSINRGSTYTQYTLFTDDEPAGGEVINSSRYASFSSYTKTGTGVMTTYQTGNHFASDIISAGTTPNHFGYQVRVRVNTGAEVTNLTYFMAERGYGNTPGTIINRYGYIYDDLPSTDAVVTTNNWGFVCRNFNAGQGTSRIGFKSELRQAGGTWAIYTEGIGGLISADSYIGGRLGVGLGMSAPIYNLDVFATARISNTGGSAGLGLEALPTQIAYLDIRSDANARWRFWRTTTTEVASDPGGVGSDLAIQRYRNGPVDLGTVLLLERKSGWVRVGSAVPPTVQLDVSGELESSVASAVVASLGLARSDRNRWKWQTVTDTDAGVTAVYSANSHIALWRFRDDGTSDANSQTVQVNRDTGIWNFTSAPQVGGVGVVAGAGSLNYLARWTGTGTTLGLGTTQDNGLAVSIGVGGAIGSTVATTLRVDQLASRAAYTPITYGISVTHSDDDTVPVATQRYVAAFTYVKNGSAANTGQSLGVSQYSQISSGSDGSHTGFYQSTNLYPGTALTGTLRQFYADRNYITYSTGTRGIVVNRYGFFSNDFNAGGHLTVTNNYVYFAAEQSACTNIYGFSSQISSGTNKWGLYFSGTAQNYLQGNLGLGIAVATEKLDVVGNAKVSAAITAGTTVAAGTAITAGTTITAGGLVTGSGLKATLLTNKTFIGTDATGVLEERLVTPGTIGAVSGSGTNNVLPRWNGTGSVLKDSGVTDDDNALTVDRRLHTRSQSLNANLAIASSQCEWYQYSANTDPTRYYKIATFVVAANYGTLGSKVVFEVQCGQYQSNQRTSYYIEMGDRLSSTNPMRYYVRMEGASRDSGSGIQVYAEDTAFGANTKTYHVYLYTLTGFYTGTMVTAKNTGYGRTNVVFFPNPAVDTTPLGTLDFDTSTCQLNWSCLGYFNGVAGGGLMTSSVFNVTGVLSVKPIPPPNSGLSMLQVGASFTSTGISWINQGLRINGALAVHDPADPFPGSDPTAHSQIVSVKAIGTTMTFLGALSPTFYVSGAVVSNGGTTTGYVGFNPGTVTNPGYVNFYTKFNVEGTDTTLTRRGYIGWRSKVIGPPERNRLMIIAEGGWTWYMQGMLESADLISANGLADYSLLDAKLVKTNALTGRLEEQTLSGLNLPVGSGTDNYVVRWMPDNTVAGTTTNILGIGVIQDDGTGVGLGAAPLAGYRMFVNGQSYFNQPITLAAVSGGNLGAIYFWGVSTYQIKMDQTANTGSVAGAPSSVYSMLFEMGGVNNYGFVWKNPVATGSAAVANMQLHGLEGLFVKDGVHTFKSNSGRFGAGTTMPTVWRNVAYWDPYLATYTGAVIIKVAASYTQRMINMRVTGFTYTPTGSSWDFNIGGYTYTVAPTWWLVPKITWSSTLPLTGTNEFKRIRLAHNPTTGEYGIILGETTTVWSWSRLVISEMMVTHTGTTIDPASVISITQTTDTSAWTEVSLDVTMTNVNTGSGSVGYTNFLPRWANTTGSLIPSGVSDNGITVASARPLSVTGTIDATAHITTTGFLRSITTGHAGITLSGNVPNFGFIDFMRESASKYRWRFYMNGTAENADGLDTGNIGSDLSLIRYGLASTLLGYVFLISRSTGFMRLGNNLTPATVQLDVTGAIGASLGVTALGLVTGAGLVDSLMGTQPLIGASAGRLVAATIASAGGVGLPVAGTAGTLPVFLAGGITIGDSVLAQGSGTLTYTSNNAAALFTINSSANGSPVIGFSQASVLKWSLVGGAVGDTNFYIRRQPSTEYVFKIPAATGSPLDFQVVPTVNGVPLIAMVPPYTTGTENYLPRWGPGGKTLWDSLIRDDGFSILLGRNTSVTGQMLAQWVVSRAVTGAPAQVDTESDADQPGVVRFRARRPTLYDSWIIGRDGTEKFFINYYRASDGVYDWQPFIADGATKKVNLRGGVTLDSQLLGTSINMSGDIIATDITARSTVFGAYRVETKSLVSGISVFGEEGFKWASGPIAGTQQTIISVNGETGTFQLTCPLASQGGLSIGLQGVLAPTSVNSMALVYQDKDGFTGSTVLPFAAWLFQNSVRTFGVTIKGDLLMSNAANTGTENPFPTTATGGFFWLNTVVDVPVGVPVPLRKTDQSSPPAVPVLFCHADNALYARKGGVWIKASGGGSGGPGSGTPNTVPKWNGAGTGLTNSNIFDAGTAVAVYSHLYVSPYVAGSIDDDADFYINTKDTRLGQIKFMRHKGAGNQPRWVWTMASNPTELITGTLKAGSDMTLYRYNDGGALVPAETVDSIPGQAGRILNISRNSGVVDFEYRPTFRGTPLASGSGIVVAVPATQNKLSKWSVTGGASLTDSSLTDTGSAITTTSTFGSGAITSSGIVKGTQFESTAPNGTAPFVLAAGNITKVTSLNADLLDGFDESIFARKAITVSGQWSITGGGDLSANRAFYLVGESGAAMAVNQYYGTSSASANRGWQTFDADLVAIAAIPDANLGYLRKVSTGPNVWQTDTTIPEGSVAFGNKTANTVFAGPASGVAAAPAFRALVAADLAGIAYVSGSGNGTKIPKWNAAAGSATSSLIDSTISDSGTVVEITSQRLQVKPGANAAQVRVNVIRTQTAAYEWLRNDNASINVVRWALQMVANADSSEPVTGALRVGSNLVLNRYDDSGTLVGKIFEADRNSGIVTFQYKPKALSPDNTGTATNVVLENRTISAEAITGGTGSVVTSGDDLSANRTLKLSGETAVPATAQYYGTPATGGGTTRGWQNLPASGGAVGPGTGSRLAKWAGTGSSTTLDSSGVSEDTTNKNITLPTDYFAHLGRQVRLNTLAGSDTILQVDTINGRTGEVNFMTGLTNRWKIQKTNESEVGASTGSNLDFLRVTDGGSIFSTAKVDRATGLWDFAVTPTVGGNPLGVQGAQAQTVTFIDGQNVGVPLQMPVTASFQAFYGSEHAAFIVDFRPTTYRMSFLHYAGTLASGCSVGFQLSASSDFTTGVTTYMWPVSNTTLGRRTTGKLTASPPPAAGSTFYVRFGYISNGGSDTSIQVSLWTLTLIP